MARNSTTVNLGVIGCGRVAQNRHLPALHGLADARVVALADVDMSSLERVADRFRIKDRFVDYRSLLDQKEIDAVAICVPALFHEEVASATLDAGKHILVEKPLALSLDGCDRLVERAARSDLKAMVGFNMRWHRLVRKARAIVQRDSLGSLELVRTVFTHPPHERVPEWRKWREQGGGEIFETAVHHFDLWTYFLESEILEVSATSRSGLWDDEAVTVTARAANGVLISTMVSANTSAANEIDIFGENGCLRLSCYQFDGLRFVPSSQTSGSLRGWIGRTGRLPVAFLRALPAIRLGGDWVASYRAEWRHFLDAIQQDRPVVSTLADGRRAVQIALATMQSASQGRPVEVAHAARNVSPTARVSG